MKMRGVPVICAMVMTLMSAAHPRAQTPAASEIATPRDGLRPVPLPRLDDLEPTVVEQIREQEGALRALVDGSSGSRLAEGYGQAGRLFHAYEFFESAEAAYLNAIRLASSEGTWLHLLGHLYQQTGQLEQAADRFEQAIRVQPDDRAAIVRLAQVYLDLNRLREAQEQFQRVDAAFPILSRNGLGEIALRERRYDEAVSHFRAVLARAPQASSVHYSLAMAYRGLGRLDEARAELAQRGPGH